MSTPTPRTDEAQFGTGRVSVEFARTLEHELEKTQKENNYLRGIVALNHEKCLHCGLEDKSKCVRGFPGCAWADDLMCGEEEQFHRFADEIRQVKTELEQAKADRAKAAMEERNKYFSQLNAHKAALEMAMDVLTETPHRINKAEIVGEWSALNLNPSDIRNEQNAQNRFFEKHKKALSALAKVKEGK